MRARGIEVPKILLKTLGTEIGGVSDPLATRPSQRVNILNLLVLQVKWYERTGTEIRQKNGPLASRLSKSLQVNQVIGTAANDFILVIHNNHGPVSYRFRDERR